VTEPRFGALRSVVVYGAGGHGVVVADAASCAGLEVLGFLDDQRAVGEVMAGGRVLGPARSWQALPGVGLALGVGDNALRRLLLEPMVLAEIELATVVHPSAVVAKSASLGAGVVVLALAVINPGARVGRGAIINSGSVIEHDVSVGDFAHVSPNATLAGGATLGELSQLGAGACVLPRVRVGRNCIVGAGAVVTRDVPDNSVCMGVPARVTRQLEG